VTDTSLPCRCSRKIGHSCPSGSLAIVSVALISHASPDHRFDHGAAMAEQDFADNRRIFVVCKVEKRVGAPAHRPLTVRSVDRAGGKTQLCIVRQTIDEGIAAIPELRRLCRSSIGNGHARRHPSRLGRM